MLDERELLQPLLQTRSAVWFLWTLCWSLALLSALLFVYQVQYEVEPGIKYRDTPGAWLLLAGHLVRGVIGVLFAESLGHYLATLKRCRLHEASNVASLVAALARLWRRLACGAALAVAYAVWIALSIYFPRAPVAEFTRFQAPAGLPAVLVEFYLAEDQPGEGLKKELLPDVGVVVYRSDAPFLTNTEVARATVTISEDGQPAIGVVFTPEGGEKMREVTRQNIDKRILIMIEGEARTAPYIRTTIGEHAMITGQFTREEAKRIADGMVERQ